MPNNNKSSIVFFGTGQTSLDALQCLYEKYYIELVVTKPPATNSAGKLFKNSVHVWAQDAGIKVLNPKDKASLGLMLKEETIKSQLGVVLDFGTIIPPEVIDIFPLGILNSHFSLLPKYRGSNPIRTSILNGDDTSGVTIIRITPGLDDGPILTWSEINIAGLNATTLRDDLSKINCALLPETVGMYLNNELELISQDESATTHTHKTTKEDGRIDTSKQPKQLAREILAYAGWPKSYVSIDGKDIIILEANPSELTPPRGELRIEDKKLYLGCANGSLEIIKIQPAGKPALSALDFINGYQNIIGK